MKPLIALTLALATLTSQASDEPTTQEICKSIADLAEVIMQARQNGRDMSVLMDLVGESFEDAEVRRPYDRMVVLAYDSPRFSVEKNQQDAVSDFKNSVYLSCFKARAS